MHNSHKFMPRKLLLAMMAVSASTTATVSYTHLTLPTKRIV